MGGDAVDVLNDPYLKIVPLILVFWSFIYAWAMKLSAPSLIGSHIRFNSAFFASFAGIVMPALLIFLVLSPHIAITETNWRGPVQALSFLTIFLVGAAITFFWFARVTVPE